MEKTLLDNLDRKRHLIDNIIISKDGPIPSFIDLNTGEYCNRKCTFCPRHDSSIYPNQDLYMSVSLSEKIADDLIQIGFNGIINICGYGEPLAHPNLSKIVYNLSKVSHVEIVTNGDLLELDLVTKLFDSGLSQLVISAYDGPHQIPKFSKMMKDAKVSGNLYNIRNRWFSEKEGYGIKLTNRAGILNHNKAINEPQRTCAYPHYSLTIDWNGDVLLCVQDWYKKLKFGNIFSDSIKNIWFSKKMNLYRKKLLHGRSCAGFPCVNCDADGLVFGKFHQKAWEKFLT